MQRQIDIVELLNILEIPTNALAFTQVADFKAQQQGLDELKKKAKQQRKLLAKIYHPDKQDGDEEKMAQINNAADIIKKLQIMRPRPVIRYHVIINNWEDTTSSTTYNSTSYTSASAW